MKAVNLLPPELRGPGRRSGKSAGTPVEAPGGSGPFVVLGALALCVAGLAGYVVTGNAVKDREAELASVTAELTSVQRTAAELKPYGDFQDLAQRRVETVRGLASLRFDWEQALRDVSRATPGGVTLSELAGTTTAGLEGGGSNALRTAISAPAIELKGCTVTQPGVARLMSRLRTIPGVTRVTLSKSDKETVTSTGMVGTSSTGDAGACGPKAPSFEMVVFFERATAQAAAADPAAVPATAVPAPAATPQAGETQPASQTTGATTAP